MQIKPLSDRLKAHLAKHQLDRKFAKQTNLLQENFRHPSLHTKLLEPKTAGVYSFRIDRKYRTLFVILDHEIEIIDINDHYQ